MGDGMCRFKCGNDAFELGEQDEGLERFAIRGRKIFHPTHVLQPGMLRPDTGIVQPGRNGVRFENLAVAVLQQVGAGAVQNTGRSLGKRCGMAGGIRALA